MELTTRQKSFTLAGLLLALFLGALDQTVVATALPKIVQDLRGLDRYAWVATAYLLASTIMVPIYGKLADTVNRKTVELVAVALFLAGSFLCGLSGAVPLAIQNAMEPRFIGQATSTSIFFRQIGGTVGAAIMGTVLAGVLATSLAGLPRFGAQAGAGDPPSTAAALGSASPAQIGQEVRAAFDRQYALVERVYRYRDFQALEQLLVNPQVPAQAKEQLKALVNGGSPQPSAQGSEQALAAIKVRLTQQADLVAAAVLRTLKTAFARSVTRIFFYTIFIVVAAWVMTLFIPELPLRRTQEQSGAAAAG